MKALCSHTSALRQGYFPGFPGMPSALKRKKPLDTCVFLTPVVWGATTSAVLAAMPRPCRQGYLKDSGCLRTALAAVPGEKDAAGCAGGTGSSARHHLGQAGASSSRQGLGAGQGFWVGVKPYTRCLLSLSTAWGWFCLPTVPTTSRPTSVTRSCK